MQRTCVGSGVPGDFWEHGHTIVPGTEEFVFRVNRRSETSCYKRRRCTYCESTRYTHMKRVDFRTKALGTHRKHAKRMVERDMAESIEAAKRMLNMAGVTIEFIAGVLLAAMGKPCPGLCGWPERHVITAEYDCQFDWRDPVSLLTPENSGPLCATCNQQKGKGTWAEFMARQRAIRHNLEHAKALGPPLRLFDLDEWVS